MTLDMTDKAVSTDAAEGDAGGAPWRVVQLESLLAALVDSKVVAMKADSSGSGHGSLWQFQYRTTPGATVSSHHKRRSGSSSPSNPSPRSQNHRHHDLHRSYHYSHPKHHHHHCHRKRSLAKVHQWDDGTALILTNGSDPSQVETTFSSNREVSQCHCRQHKLSRLAEEGYVSVDMEGKQRRKRRRRRRDIKGNGSLKTRVKVIDPEELPKRARWTIIITAGFLLLTCMLLVGITLRMAPIIDQMVRNENEQLMNSINRQQEFNESYDSMIA